MAKAKKAQGQPSVMDQLAAYQPTWFDDSEKKEDKADPRDEQIKTLTERLAAIERDSQAARQQQMLQQFASTPAVQTQVQAQKVSADVNMDGLPDPVVDKDAYSRELIKRINAANDANLAVDRAERQVEQERSSLATNLWDGFQKAHPAWADHEMLVEAAAQRVSHSMAGRGINVVQLMKSAPEMFYNEVAGILDKQYPQLKEAKEEGDEEPEGGGENRTAGVFGGTPGKQTGGQQQAEPEESSMLREMAEMRFKAGIR